MRHLLLAATLAAGACAPSLAMACEVIYVGRNTLPDRTAPRFEGVVLGHRPLPPDRARDEGRVFALDVQPIRIVSGDFSDDERRSVRVLFEPDCPLGWYEETVREAFPPGTTVRVLGAWARLSGTAVTRAILAEHLPRGAETWPLEPTGDVDFGAFPDGGGFSSGLTFEFERIVVDLYRPAATAMQVSRLRNLMDYWEILRGRGGRALYSAALEAAGLPRRERRALLTEFARKYDPFPEQR